MRNITQQSSVMLPNDGVRKNTYGFSMNEKPYTPMLVIDHILKEKDISASALCNKANIAPSVINKKKNGTDPTGFTYDILTKLAHAGGYESYEHAATDWMNKRQPYTLSSIGTDVHEIKKNISFALHQIAKLTADSELDRWKKTTAND